MIVKIGAWKYVPIFLHIHYKNYYINFFYNEKFHFYRFTLYKNILLVYTNL